MAKKKTKSDKHSQLLDNLEFQFDEIMAKLRGLVEGKEFKVKHERVVLELKYSVNSIDKKLQPQISVDKMPW